ncbi:unnamed protein product [Phytophthora fragariaefolia]|uniref:Unnamed protein product n=1 Tax=Phytophthora fragariaefolia TaxID=1490495 RepID=A0A9W6TZT9_9STRA|nr:unnamed protein product [Phytophthora fragariaefolia]
MKHVRVRNALRYKFGLDGATLPRLRAVQNFINYYSKTQLGCNDNYDEIWNVVPDMAYSGGDDNNALISFTYGKNSEGDLSVGDGSDSEPFVVGITSRTLLKRLYRDPDWLFFHLDATFKLSQVGYAVLVLGISDRARVFHLVTFIITSQRVESIYTVALLAFQASYAEVTGNQFRLKYVVGDAEDGQLNALEKVFRYDSDFTFLMCVFHVMKKVHERTKVLQYQHAWQTVCFLKFTTCNSAQRTINWFESRVLTCISGATRTN